MEQYDSDRDIVETGGIFGMTLANALFEKAGGFERYFSQTPQEEPIKTKKKRSKRRPKPIDYQNDPEALKIVAGVALMPFSHLDTAERVWTQEYRKRLSDLMHAGYPVEVGFSRGDRGSLMSMYRDIVGEIEDLLEQYPEIKADINERNRRLRSPQGY